MDKKDLQMKSVSELTEILLNTQNELTELRSKVKENQLKNVRQIRKLRITIAQVNTFINALRVKRN